MKYSFITLFVLIGFVISAGAQGINPDVIELSPDLSVRQLTRRVWIYTATAQLPGIENPVPANGLVLTSGYSAMLINLTWNDDQARVLADWINTRFEGKIELAVPTHAHQDCAGGLGAIKELGAEIWALHKTTVKLYDLGGAVPNKSFQGEKALFCGDLEVELFFPGPGHTDDNIVAWIPEEKVLFGGCLLRALEAQDLGNVAEADLKAYPDTLKEVQDRYKDAEIVVPGHGNPGNRDLIKQTINLSKKQKKR